MVKTSVGKCGRRLLILKGHLTLLCVKWLYFFIFGGIKMATQLELARQGKINRSDGQL